MGPSGAPTVYGLTKRMCYNALNSKNCLNLCVYALNHEIG